MEKINAENEAKIARIAAAMLIKLKLTSIREKRKRRLATVKGDAAKTLRKYQTEKNKQKAVEQAGERFVANLPKTAQDKSFDQKVAEIKEKIKDGVSTARHVA